MNTNLKCVNIIQNVRGSVQFSQVGDKEQPTNEILITLNLKDPKDAAKYEIGTSYEITIKPVKS